VRVSSDKLDALVDLVGELVTLQARISQVSLIVHDTQLTSMSEQLERLTADLRDNAMTLRMLPIGTTFSKFKRLVRDLSDDLGKKIEMETSGAETELDKTVIEKLNDPLIHLIRNCIDHGIETPDVRAKAGKSETGTIKLSALHSGASVIITVEDDGAGLNRKAILSKAIQRGIVGPDDELSDEELCCMIFAPGFSTAQKVTSVSGRGVGMDVVKKEIESLGGFVTVKSEEGKNTRVILSIPLTLAIIEGFLVKVGSDFYVLPLSSVEACIELTQEERAQHKGRRIINFRNEILSYVRLRDVFEIEGDEREIEQIVVVRSLDMRVGFVVDQVIGDYQTVIKSLGRIYKDVEGVSGATILGDGTVALILDINKLADIAHREETAELRR
jgi:two-component system chemotaxis sensor kinase CheA